MLVEVSTRWTQHYSLLFSLLFFCHHPSVSYPSLSVFYPVSSSLALVLVYLVARRYLPCIFLWLSLTRTPERCPFITRHRCRCVMCCTTSISHPCVFPCSRSQPPALRARARNPIGKARLAGRVHLDDSCDVWAGTMIQHRAAVIVLRLPN